MKIALFGKQIPKESLPDFIKLFEVLVRHEVKVVLFEDLEPSQRIHLPEYANYAELFSSHEDLIRIRPDFLVCLGGDGTILDSVSMIRDTGIPIMGINLGRLGFLANVAKEDAGIAICDLIKGRFVINERNLISMHIDNPEIEIAQNFALNEVAVSRKDTTAMITVHAYINNEYLNSYWADGLIVATPTGSTGYSLSCGGPIIMPGSENFVITPIAPHNLNVRPFVIPNHLKIRLKIESREMDFLASTDSKIYKLPCSTELLLERAPFKIKMVQTHNQDFPATLRKKLMWGLDRRN
jgi:NAD+ kinase